MGEREVRGSCLCGGVAFRASGMRTPILYCHAQRCRKATGGAFAPEMLVAAGGFAWERGEALITKFEAPLLSEPPPYRRAFCSVCGSPLPIALEGTPFVLLLPGTLDDDPETRPFRHGYVGQKACWHEITDKMPRFEGQPDAPPPEWLEEQMGRGHDA